MRSINWFHKNKNEKVFLVISDSHMENEKMEKVLDRYEGKVDLKIHCGDIQLSAKDPLCKRFDIVVRGNHDPQDLPPLIIQDGMCVTHGHLQNVYQGYDRLIQLCQEQGCSLCFHGHTHIPCFEKRQGITFINPGSISFNRGSIFTTSYAIVSIGREIHVTFLNADTHKKLPEKVLSEGKALMEHYANMFSQAH